MSLLTILDSLALFLQRIYSFATFVTFFNAIIASLLRFFDLKWRKMKRPAKISDTSFSSFRNSKTKTQEEIPEEKRLHAK